MVGEAAHVLPPIGAQGLNLGYRDVLCLGEAVLETRERGDDDSGAPAILGRYERKRRLVIASRTTTTTLLNKTLTEGGIAGTASRFFGLHAINAIGPLRRRAIREGMGPPLHTRRIAEALAGDCGPTSPPSPDQSAPA